MGDKGKPNAKTVHLADFGRYKRVLEDDDENDATTKSDRWGVLSPTPAGRVSTPQRTSFVLDDLLTIMNAELDALARHLIGRGFREFKSTLDRDTRGQATVCLRRGVWLWGLLGSRVLGNDGKDFQDWLSGIALSALPAQGSPDDRAFPSPILRPNAILPEVCAALGIVLRGSIRDERSSVDSGLSLFVTDYGRRIPVDDETLGVRAARTLPNGAFLTALELLLALIQSQTLLRALCTGREFGALGSRIGWFGKVPVFYWKANGTIGCRGVSPRTKIGRMRCPARWTPS